MKYPRFRLRGYNHKRRTGSISPLQLPPAHEQLGCPWRDARDEVLVEDEDEDEDEDNRSTGQQELRNDDVKRLRSGKVINITPTKTKSINTPKSSITEPTPTENESPAWQKFLTPVKSPKLQAQKSGQKSLLDGNNSYNGIIKRSIEIRSPDFGKASLPAVRESNKELLNETILVNGSGEESTEINSPLFRDAPLISENDIIRRPKTSDYLHPEDSPDDGYFYDPLRLPHPKTTDPKIIYRHVKVPLERRIPQIVYLPILISL
jgi:hypothetical protein